MIRLFSKILISIVLTLIMSGQALAQTTPQLFSLGTPKGPRFTVPDIQWPLNHGDASVCLWADDKLCVVTMAMDDNCADKVPWWFAQNDTFGFHFTWFLIAIDISNYNTQYSAGTYGGTWALWRQAFARGNACESHTMTHCNIAYHQTHSFVQDYGLAQKLLRDSIPGNRCYTFAPPGGEYANNIDSAALWYIAIRGGPWAPSQPNLINFRSVSTGGYDSNAVLAMLNKTTRYNNVNYYRGFFGPFCHSVDDGPTGGYMTNKGEIVAFMRSLKAHQSQIWQTVFPDFVRYNMEYATNKLTTVQVSDTLLRYTLSDSMADTIYNYPLSIKIRLNNWTTVHAAQNGSVISCSLLTYNGSKYALIKAVPDKGEIRLTKAATAIIRETSPVWRAPVKHSSRNYFINGRKLLPNQKEIGHVVYLKQNGISGHLTREIDLR
jgi:hypothetical protein